MDASFEDLVTDSMQRRAAAVGIPDDIGGLARRARTQHRRRRYLLRSGLTAVTAAGLAVVVPLATQAGPGALPAQTAAYVMRHAEHSIAASAATKVEVVHVSSDGIRTPFAAPGSTVEVPDTTTWSYRTDQREMAYAADGRPLLDTAFVNPASSRGTNRVGVDAGVDYITGTWWRSPAPATYVITGPPPTSCQRTPTVFLDPIFWPGETPSARWLRYYLQCGLLRLAGRQRVAGVDAIKIVSAGWPTLRQVIWVDPETYLPVQVLVLRTAGTRWSIRADYRWLPATPRNLALLSPPVPAGFRRVQFSNPQPVSQLIPLGD